MNKTKSKKLSFFSKKGKLTKCKCVIKRAEYHAIAYPPPSVKIAI